MPSTVSFITLNSVKSYISKATKMRSRDEAIKELIKKFDSTIVAVIEYARARAEEEKRTTIMKEDIVLALEHHIGKRQLTWQETADEVILKNPTDLGRITTAIKDYIKTHKK